MSRASAAPQVAERSSSASPAPRKDRLQLARDGARPRRFTTRGRLYVAVAALAAWFAAACLLQLTGLSGMERALHTLDAQQERMRLALELEGALRGQYARQGQIAAGDEGLLDEYRVEKERIERLTGQLASHVDDPESKGRFADIVAASKELERMFEEEIFPAARAGKPGTARAHQATYRLVFDVEENVDALFAHIRERTVHESDVVDHMRASTLRLAVLFLAGVPILALALAAYLSRSIARPLRALGEGAARIAGGDLTSRVDAGGPHEFDVLAAQVNDMAASLKRGREELVRAQTLAGLGRMAAGIAHEINNPLQVMLGYLSLHRERVHGELGRDLERMEREATRCREIVEALLKLSRPTMPAPAGAVDLRALGEDVASALRVALAGRVPAFSVVGEATALAVPTAVRQIVLNLAKNAAEAAGPSGRVEIRLGQDGSRALVTVSDDGPGIAPEARERIFDPFFTTKQTGTGLGLAIARAMAGALGGDLELESGDGGARFTLRLPLATPGRRT